MQNTIISYRMKAGSKQFKEYVLDEKDYVNDGGFDITKLVILHLHTIKKRINGHFRRQIISFRSIKLERTKDKNW